MESSSFDALVNFLSRVPAVQPGISYRLNDDKKWWVKFSLDVTNNLAWNVVQELGHVFNYISLEERLPTAFYPVSAPPYMNGGPADFIYWIIDSSDPAFTPDKACEWLEGRLPNPVDNIGEWTTDD